MGMGMVQVVEMVEVVGIAKMGVKSKTMFRILHNFSSTFKC